MSKYKYIEAFILAGGKSSRMGADKGLVLLRGKPMIQYVIDSLSYFEMPVNIVSNNRDYNTFNIPVYSDIIADKGPMGGLYTALSYSVCDKILLLSCDAPFISASAIEYLMRNSGDEDLTFAEADNEAYPLFSIYRKRIKDCVRMNIENNKLKMKDLIYSSSFRAINMNKFLHESPDLLLNINTKKELDNIYIMNETIKIKAFGVIAERAGTNELSVPLADSVSDLLNELYEKYPAISGYNFAVAANHKIVDSDYHISVNDEIALLPPFSGG